MTGNTLSQLPYIDGLPEVEGQQRLSWIKNGELLEGAESRFGHDGNLNKVGVQLQENIKYLAEHFDFINADFEVNNAKLAELIEMLGDAATSELIDLVNKHSDDINSINDLIVVLTHRIDNLDTTVGNLTSLVGAHKPESGPNNIFDDLLFIKTEIGNKQDFDINGQSLPGNQSTGLIYQVDTIGRQTSANEDAITLIIDELTDGNFTQIHKDLSQIRTELGPTPAGATITPVYTRLTALETGAASTDTDIAKIREDIGPGKLVDSVTANETAIELLDTQINSTNGLANTVNALSLEISDPNTGLTKKLNDTNAKVDGLTTTIGTSDANGLQKEIKDLKVALGTSETPSPAGSALGRIILIEADQVSTFATVQDIQVILGTSTTGLQGEVDKHEKAIYGNPAGASPIEQAGLFAATNSILNTQNSITPIVMQLLNAQIYKDQTVSVLGDATTTVTSSNIIVDTGMRIGLNDVKATAGVATITSNSNYSSAITSNIIVINTGTYDYLFNTTLGTIADAVDGYAGTPTFYSELYKLLSSVTSASPTNKVILTTGVRYYNAFGSSTVTYPSLNANSNSAADFTKAIKDVGAIFALPVLDSNNLLGINQKNYTTFTTSAGLSTEGVTRARKVIANFIRSI